MGVVSALVLLASLIVAKVDYVLIDKKKGYISKQQTLICCIRRRHSRKLKDLINIAAHKKGHKSFSAQTTFYLVKASFQKEEPLILLSSISKEKIIENLV